MRPEEGVAPTIQQQRDVAAAAAEAREALADPGPPVAFSDILQNPDDIRLNLRYALQQIQSGDLKGAVATLERILILQPSIGEVRLLYGIVLFRLDALDEAERELRALARAELPSDLRQQVQFYLSEIENRRKRLRHLLTVTFGSHFDTNRNSAPRDGQNYVLGLPNPSREVPQADFAYTTLLDYRLRYDPGFQNRHELLFGLNGLRDDQARLDRQRFWAGRAELGARLRYGFLTLTPMAVVTSLRLGGDHFLRQRGGDLRTDIRLGQGLEAFVEGQYRYDRFQNTRDSNQLKFRTGPRWLGRSGVNYTLTPTHRLGASVSYERKAARQDIYAYWDVNGAVNHTWLLGSGQFLLTQLNHGRRRYMRQDPLIASNRRFDELWSLGVTYGLPVGTILPKEWFSGSIGGPIGDFIGDMTLSAGVTYTRQNSNQPNFEYRNWRYQLFLSKRWSF